MLFSLNILSKELEISNDLAEIDLNVVEEIINIIEEQNNKNAVRQNLRILNPKRYLNGIFCEYSKYWVLLALKH